MIKLPAVTLPPALTVPPVDTLPTVAVPVADTTPVIYSPVVAQTTTLLVPPILTVAFPPELLTLTLDVPNCILVASIPVN